MDPRGKTAEQILAFQVTDQLNGANWHFFQCKSWIDLAKRSQAPAIIHFAALELRYGIEYLLFELLVLSSESMSEKDYQKCIGDPHEMKRMLGRHAANYEQLAEFSKVIITLSNPGFKSQIWDVRRLFATWGISSEYLHFLGIHRDNQQNLTWLIQSIARLEEQLEPIWKAMTETHGTGIMRPSRMVPEVKQAWQEFVAGTISLEDVNLRLKLRFPTGWISGKQIEGI